MNHILIKYLDVLGLRNEIVVYLTWMLCSRQCRAFNHSELEMPLFDIYQA